MPAWRFEMFYLGQFARPEGLIYGCFTDDMLEDPFPIPVDWPRTVGLDFGGANQALIWLAQDPATEIWHLYDESLSGEKTTAEHAAEAKAKAAGLTDVTYCGGSPSETQQRRDWRAEGVWTQEPSIGALEPGIDRGIRLIKENKLRVFRTCRGFRDEIGTYRRKLDDAGRPTEDIVDKRAFHRLDAYRYAAIQITSGRAFQYGFV